MGTGGSGNVFRYAFDELRALTLDPAATPDDASRVIATTAEAIHWPEADMRAVYEETLRRDLLLAEQPPREAVCAQLRLMTLLSPVEDATLWIRSTTGQLSCVASVGREAPSRRMREVARRVFDGAAAAPARGANLLHGVEVRRWGTLGAVLVVRARPRSGADAAEAAASTAGFLGPLLERAALLEAGEERESTLTIASTRGLARLTLDIHDGPLQDVVALLNDVRLYREQLSPVLQDEPRGDLLLGRVDDFEARLLALDDDLRELAQSFQSPSMLEQPLEDVLGREAEMVRSRTGAAVTLQLAVDPESLTRSQRIAIIRIVQEALTNIRDHSDAHSVKISAVTAEGHTRVCVTDDGCGFDVGPTLVRAARRGRLGLVGMAERVRLLGGTFDVRSSVGRGTTIAAVLPEWKPFDDRPAAPIP